MRKLWLAAIVCVPLIAQVPVKKPLGNTRFLAAKDLEWKPAPGTMAKTPATEIKEPSKAEITLGRQMVVIQIEQRPCAHVRRVDPSPATDPKMIVPTPQRGSNMPVVKTMPACDEVR